MSRLPIITVGLWLAVAVAASAQGAGQNNASTKAPAVNRQVTKNQIVSGQTARTPASKTGKVAARAPSRSSTKAAPPAASKAAGTGPGKTRSHPSAVGPSAVSPAVGPSAVGKSSASKGVVGKGAAARNRTTPRGRAVARAPSWRTAQQTPSTDRYREIQQALADKGYFQGPVDGVWGPESTDALKRFQRDQNLETDGKIGSLSLMALGLGPKRGAPAALATGGSRSIEQPAQEAPVPAAPAAP